MRCVYITVRSKDCTGLTDVLLFLIIHPYGRIRESGAERRLEKHCFTQVHMLSFRQSCVRIRLGAGGVSKDLGGNSYDNVAGLWS